MIQDFYVNEIKETLETEDLYSIMNKRMTQCKNYQIGEYNGGPPDIYYIVRETQMKGFLGFGGKKLPKTGAYHYVYGLNTSNVAFISAYLSKFIQTTKILASNTKITQSIFCAFDLFYEKDLRILIKFPGGIKKIFYIDDSQAIEANPEELRTVFLSSVLRSWNFNEFPIPTNCLFLEELNNSKAFEYLVESITFLINEKAEYKYPNFDKKIEVFLIWFIRYLMATRRYSFAVSYFSQLSYADSSLAKYVIQPLKFLQCYEDALQFISRLLCTTSSPTLICYEIDLLTILQKYQDALELAKYVTSINPECADCWLALANLYLHQKKYDRCLLVLNNIFFLKEYTADDIKKMILPSKALIINEIPLQKINNTLLPSFKLYDLLYCPKHYIDFYYGCSQFYLCENSDVLQDTITKILTSSYFSFDNTQQRIYSLLLDMIKEINFDTFIDLKNKMFCNNSLMKLKDKYNNDKDINKDNDDKGINEPSEDNMQYCSSSMMKISINPYLEIIVTNLIEDLKLFSVVISQEDSYFQSLISKDDLAIAEVKFCIAFALISERLKYYHTAIKFYKKALMFSFSKFVYERMIKLYIKLKEFKTAMVNIGELLKVLTNEQLTNMNKTPLWIDKIVLKTLFEFQASEIIQWLNGSRKTVIEYIKSIINKYKYWIEAGHELHLIKEMN